PADVPRGQLRIVGRNRAGADHDRVAKRAHAVQVADVLLAGHVLRLTGMRGDETVEALAEVADRDRPRDRGAADWQIEIDQRMRRIVGWEQNVPTGARAPADDRLTAVARDDEQH